MNGLHENVQNREERDSCKLTPSAIGENNNVLANELDGKLGDETANVIEENSCRNEALPTQDGEDMQVKIPRDTLAIEVDHFSSRGSLDAPVSLCSDKESKKECSNAENQECNTNNRGDILPNLAQTSNCSSENLQSVEHSDTSCQKQTATPATLPNTVQDSTQGSKQESGLPLPVISPLEDSGTVSTYFTRSAKKARLTSFVQDKELPAQNTTPTASGLTASSKPVTTFAVISPKQGSESATTINPAPPVQDVLANSGSSSPYFTRSATKKAGLTSSVPHKALTAQSTSTAYSLVMPGTPTTTSGLANSSKPFSSVPAPKNLTTTAAQDVSQTTTITGTSTSIDSPMSGMITLPIIPVSLSNIRLVVKQDSPVSTSSVPVHTVTSQSLAQALATCTSTPCTGPVPMSNLFVKHDDPVSASSNPPVHIVTPQSLEQALATCTSTPATVPAPSSNLIIKQDNPVSTSSNPVHFVTSQSLTQALATCTLPKPISATSTTTVNSNTPVMIPSLVCSSEKAQPTIVSSAMSATPSSSSLSSTSNCTALATIPFPIPLAIKSVEPEVPVEASNHETATANATKTSTYPIENTTLGSASTTNSSTALTDIPAIFPDFTPCPKCNSILVCSCPGPSGIGEGSRVASTTCQAACQGVCTCNGMEVNQADGSNPCDEDVKPQIFPTVPLNVLDQLFDDLVEYDKVAKAEQPEAITTRLFPYQLQALNWMITRENNTDLAPFWKQVNKSTWFNKGTNMSTDRKPNSPKGGILADDMGLGKTLTVITLIMANHLNGKPMFSRKSSANKRAASTSGQDGECKSEPAEKMPRKGSYNGDNDGDVEMENKEATKTVTIKKRKDVVDKKKRLADSKTLKQPGFKFRQMYLPKFSSKSVKKEKLEEKKEVTKPKITPSVAISIDIDDGAPWLSAGSGSIGAKGSNSSKSVSDDEHGATLIVCPLSVLSNWTDQICSHVHADVSLQVYMYYGAERLRDVNFLKQQDIVLTTYPTLTNDYGRKDSPLHKIKWLRIILDEGHTIRNPQTRLTKAMIDLAAKRRWVLTGTPIQNRLDDLWSVCKFLRLEPFDDKGWWKSALASSVRRGDQQGVNRLQKLLKHVSIRRLKTDEVEGKPLVKLPPRTVVIQEVELSEVERKLYDAMQKHGQLIIRGYLQDGTVLAKYAHCFAILMRLRQLCLHPKLCDKESASLQHAQNLLQGLDDSDDDDDLDVDHDTQRLIKDLIMTLSSGSDEECSVCLDSLVEPVITRCAHVFCQQCIMDVMTSDNLAPRCPLCRAPLNENELIKVPEKKKQKPEAKKTSEEPEKSKKSSKLDALISALCAIRDKDPSIKSLVVSQFTSFLDIIEDALKNEDFPFVRLDGRMTQEARARAIESFADPSSSSPRVFLLSLTAGGVGLNLTAATRVFLMDPAWNPAIEEQCFDRSHRLGQTREVIITKYIVMNSVEERMLSLQEQKRTLMGQAFGLQTQSQEERRRARVRDIKHLIGL
ncbi:hypothetical protein ACROYT_G000101 [Oculina patagonica]